MWKIVEYNEKPLELDKDSSSVYVYIRKNIAEENRESDGYSSTVYTCDEQKIFKTNWELYEKLITHDGALSDVEDALIELAEMIQEA